MTRRKFIARSARHASLIGLAGAAGVVSARAGRGGSAEENPFAYELGRLEKTDPKLVHYAEASRFRCAREGVRRLAVGPDDRLYLAAGNYVAVVSDTGAMVSEFALAGPPRCLAVAKDGMVYAGLRDHVEVFDQRGRRQAAWDSPGARAWLTGLAAGANDLFAADAGNRLVWRYDRSGKLVSRIGQKDNERNVPGFIVPSPFFDLRLHKDGLLRVANPGRHRVEAYTFDGDFEFAWGRASAAIDGFCGCCNPCNFALTPEGRFVTCEKGLPRVKVYGPAGEFESVVAGVESFAQNARASSGEGAGDGSKGGLDAAVDSQGRIFILDLVTGEVRLMRRKEARG